MNFGQLCTTLDGLLPASLLVESSFCAHTARLAQSVEHETLNLRVVGSSPTLGAHFFQTWAAGHHVVHDRYSTAVSVGCTHPGAMA